MDVSFSYITSQLKLFQHRSDGRSFVNAQSRYITRNSKNNDRREALAVVRDVHTRWNYTHAMIRRAELLEEVGLRQSVPPLPPDIFVQAIDDWVFKTPGLRSLLLSEDEWKTLGEIGDIIEAWVLYFVMAPF